MPLWCCTENTERKQDGVASQPNIAAQSDTAAGVNGGEDAHYDNFSRIEKSYRMMGTKFTVVVYTDQKEKAIKEIEQSFNIAAEVNAVCSDWKVTSELAKLNVAAPNKAVKLSPMLEDVLIKAERVVKLTDGSFDPTMGPHTFLWRLSRHEKKLPSTEEIAQAKLRSGWSGLKFNKANRTVTKLKPGMRIDLGGVAKGYAADLMFNHLKSKGFGISSVSAGGDLRIGDSPPYKQGWTVGIKNLDPDGKVSPKKIMLSNCAISTSGDLHQFIELAGKRYSHIVDPNTGLGLTNRISVSVVAPLATDTDMYATSACLSATFAKKLESLPKVSVLKIYQGPNGELKCSSSGVFLKK